MYSSQFNNPNVIIITLWFLLKSRYLIQIWTYITISRMWLNFVESTIRMQNPEMRYVTPAQSSYTIYQTNILYTSTGHGQVCFSQVVGITTPEVSTAPWIPEIFWILFKYVIWISFVSQLLIKGCFMAYYLQFSFSSILKSIFCPPCYRRFLI